MSTWTVHTAAALGQALGLLLGLAPAPPADWPMFGRDGSRNAVSPEKDPPLRWRVEMRDPLNVKWEAALGDCRHCASPVVAGGLVWVGDNNDRPHDPQATDDAAVLKCFRQSDGKFLWQYVSPRLDDTLHQDWPHAAFLCSPLAEGDRLYFTTNRAEVVCLDVGPLREGKGDPRRLWKLDMRKDLGVCPVGPACPGIGFTCSIGASYQGRLYVATGNGAATEGKTVPAPQAPSLVCLDRDTGKVLWSDNSPGKAILYSQWSSPLVVAAEGKAQVIAAQGDGWVRSFDPMTGELLWKFDANPKSAEWKLGGRGTRNYLPATPVFHEGRVYIGNGRAEIDGPGVGHLWCIDATRTPKNDDKDLSPVGDDFDPAAAANKDSGLVWHFGGPRTPRQEGESEWFFSRTMSSVAVHDGLVIAPDLDGYVHCLDARTGREYWTHDALAGICASPLLADGKVYISTTDGKVLVLALSREKKLLAENDVEDGVYSPTVLADGVLYLVTGSKLHAIQTGASREDK